MSKQLEDVKIEGFNRILHEFDSLLAGFEDKTVSEGKEILRLFIKVKDEAKKRNKETSYGFNVLDLFSPGETMHSILLANLLNPNSSHGQGPLFIYAFLKKLGIENPEEGQWVVTAEKGRIDVLLKRANPHAVVIIENKSNGAVDQANQLYRYWHQEIHMTVKSKTFDYYNQHPEKYKLIYLTPDEWKRPTDNSLTRPSHMPKEFPEQVPMEPVIWRFDQHIVEFLKEVIDLKETINHIPLTNHRLREYLKQYIEYWTKT